MRSLLFAPSNSLTSTLEASTPTWDPQTHPQGKHLLCIQACWHLVQQSCLGTMQCCPSCTSADVAFYSATSPE